jgi:hypothetical protein
MRSIQNSTKFVCIYKNTHFSRFSKPKLPNSQESSSTYQDSPLNNNNTTTMLFTNILYHATAMLAASITPAFAAPAEPIVDVAELIPVPDTFDGK